MDDALSLTGRTAVAIGDFDGVHSGHRRILDTLLSEARSHNAIPAVYTFKSSSKGKKCICSPNEKLSLLHSAGVSIIESASFDEVRGIPARNFVTDILISRLHAVCVVGGRISFGRDGKGDAALLKEYGIDVISVEPLTENGLEVSSTRIRSLVENGDIEDANRLLSRRYGISGEVMHGHRNGIRLGFPTANLIPSPELILPAFGVYAASVLADGKRYGGICNIGVHPTLGAEPVPLAETHIFDFDRDIYGKSITVELIKHLRGEMSFSDTDLLKAQIHKDITQCRRLLDPEE